MSQRVTNLAKKLFAIVSFMMNLCNNFLAYCPTILQCVHQFWSIYLKMYMNCITFSSKTPQILTIYLVYYEIHKICLVKTNQNKLNLTKYSC